MSYPKKCRELAKKNQRPLVMIGFDTRHMNRVPNSNMSYGSIEVHTSTSPELYSKVAALIKEIIAEKD